MKKVMMRVEQQLLKTQLKPVGNAGNQKRRKDGVS